MSFSHGSRHIGINWNAVVDQEAMNTLDNPISNCSILHTNFKPFYSEIFIKRWQDSKDQGIRSTLHEVHSYVDKTACSYGKITMRSRLY